MTACGRSKARGTEHTRSRCRSHDGWAPNTRPGLRRATGGGPGRGQHLAKPADEDAGDRASAQGGPGHRDLTSVPPAPSSGRRAQRSCRRGHGSQRGVRPAGPAPAPGSRPAPHRSLSLPRKTARAAERAAARAGRPLRARAPRASRPSRSVALRDGPPAQRPPPGALPRPGLRARRRRETAEAGPPASAGAGGAGRRPRSARYRRGHRPGPARCPHARASLCARPCPLRRLPLRRVLLVGSLNPSSARPPALPRREAGNLSATSANA